MVEGATCGIIVGSIMGGMALFSCGWLCLSGCKNNVSPAEAIKIIVQEQPPIYAEHELVISDPLADIAPPPGYVAPPPGYVE